MIKLDEKCLVLCIETVVHINLNRLLFAAGMMRGPTVMAGPNRMRWPGGESF